MNIRREGTTLVIEVDTGVGWTLRFTHARSTEVDSEALLRHIKNTYDTNERRSKQRIEDLERSLAYHRNRCSDTERTNAALRGAITRARNKLKENSKGEK